MWIYDHAHTCLNAFLFMVAGCQFVLRHRCCFSLLLGALHQSEREEERVSEHHESGSSAEGILLYILNQQHFWPVFRTFILTFLSPFTSEASQCYTRFSSGQNWIWSPDCIIDAVCVWSHSEQTCIGSTKQSAHLCTMCGIFFSFLLFFSPYIGGLVLFQLIKLHILHCLSIKPIKPLCSHRLATYFSHFLYTAFVSSRVNA